MSKPGPNQTAAMVGSAKFKKMHRNWPAPALIEESLRRGQGVLSSSGAISVLTGKYTGRSPKDKFVVEEDSTRSEIWWGDVNRPIKPDAFDRLLRKVLVYLEQKEVFVFDGYAGADPEHRLSVRFINEFPWHNLFVRQLFLRPDDAELQGHKADFTVICAPGVQAVPETDGTRSEAFILLNFLEKLVVI